MKPLSGYIYSIEDLNFNKYDIKLQCSGKSIDNLNQRFVILTEKEFIELQNKKNDESGLY